jgi:NAD dependent epimerase/dehydratase family enzyme
VPAPPFALKLALGEMAGPLLLFSQRVLPARATGAGFTFAFPELEAALRDLLG